MTALSPQGTRTTRPEEGNEPRPRDPVSVRATIGSLTDERLAEIRKRRTALLAELRSLTLEQSVLESTAELIGVTTESEGEG